MSGQKQSCKERSRMRLKSLLWDSGNKQKAEECKKSRVN